MTGGLASLKTIPCQSVDFIWSQAVLEHVKKREFRETVAEMRRIISSNGVCSHEIDFRDHLGGSLNQLRLPEKIWESSFVKNSGFYTNRLRYSQMEKIFREEGFAVKVISKKKWGSLPIPKRNMAILFRDLEEDDLNISIAQVLLYPEP
jgi:hypothetical protein